MIAEPCGCAVGSDRSNRNFETADAAPLSDLQKRDGYNELVCCLLWLRNHYETGSTDPMTREAVMKRVDAILEKHDDNITIANMRRFREENPST